MRNYFQICLQNRASGLSYCIPSFAGDFDEQASEMAYLCKRINFLKNQWLLFLPPPDILVKLVLPWTKSDSAELALEKPQE